MRSVSNISHVALTEDNLGLVSANVPLLWLQSSSTMIQYSDAFRPSSSLVSDSIN